jgi:murein DD-endopeptidase MepM/ murein hydrolase activator NlpD
LSENDKGYAPFFSIPFEGEIALSFGEMFSGRILDGIIVKGYSTKVISPLDGVVVAAGKNSVDGKYIVVSHENGYETGYYGLETVDVKKGMSIKQGDVIGSISSNGIFGKFSLLFRVEQNEVALDPELFL